MLEVTLHISLRVLVQQISGHSIQILQPDEQWLSRAVLQDNSEALAPLKPRRCPLPGLRS